MNYDVQAEKVKAFVTAYFEKRNNPNLLYHNYRHTVTVVNRAKEIAFNYPLMPDDVFVLVTAAWFHDAGQLLGTGKNHEEVSAAVMKDFLQSTDFDDAFVQPIANCILATKLPHNPTTFLDKIICDADTYHLGTDEFMHTDALLKREYELRNLSTHNWEKTTLNLLQRHCYFTSYCQERLDDGKAKNVVLVRNRLHGSRTAD